jgi:hypothetical protein
MSDSFLSRWSRRKQGLDTQEPPKTELGSRAQDVPSSGQSKLRSDAPAQSNTAAKPAAASTPTPGDVPQPPLPTLQDVQGLTPSSDFQTFMRQGVPGEVRNAAMKKLFTDPHFNVMDGLDIYIGDYTIPDPLPAGMLEKMVGAELLNLFPKKAQTEVPQADTASLLENPEQSPAVSEGSPLVAQSPPSPMTPVLQATPALQAPEPLEHDHPDLQLQPNHAPASPSSGQSTG